MGGEIGFSSTKGQGSCFYIKLKKTLGDNEVLDTSAVTGDFSTGTKSIEGTLFSASEAFNNIGEVKLLYRG